MKKYLGVLVILLLIGFIAACGDSADEEEENGAADPDEETTDPNDPQDEFDDNDGEMVETNLEFALQGGDEDGAAFVYTIENTGDQEEVLSFTTGQRYEYEITQDGEIVNTFSEGRAFTQALEDIEVAPGEEVTFDVEMPDLEPGEYEISIYLVAADYGPASAVEETFTVE